MGVSFFCLLRRFVAFPSRRCRARAAQVFTTKTPLHVFRSFRLDNNTLNEFDPMFRCWKPLGSALQRKEPVIPSDDSEKNKQKFRRAKRPLLRCSGAFKNLDSAPEIPAPCGSPRQQTAATPPGDSEPSAGVTRCSRGREGKPAQAPGGSAPPASCAAAPRCPPNQTEAELKTSESGGVASRSRKFCTTPRTNNCTIS